MVWYEKINRVLMITMLVEEGKVCVLFFASHVMPSVYTLFDFYGRPM